MNLKYIFVHDHVFKKIDSSYYSEGKITNESLDDYFLPNDKLVILSRLLEQRSNGHTLTQISLANVEFKPVKGIGFSKIFGSNLFHNLSHISKQLKDTDIIIVRLPSFLSIITLMLNHQYKKTYFVELVGDVEDALTFRKSSKNPVYNSFVIIMTRLTKKYVKNADGVIYVTKKTLQEKYPTNATLTDGVSDVILNIEEKNLTQQNYQQKNQDFITIGLIGSFNNEYKGIDVAIKAIKKLKDEGINCHLHILGSGSLKKQYLDMAKEMGLEKNIFFDGSLAGGAAVYQWLDNLDIYIQPSKTEGLPRALVEAMSRGLPIVASSVGGIPELVESKYLIQSDDYLNLAEKIKELCNSELSRFKVGQRNYQNAKAFDYQALSLRRKDFWQKARKLSVEEL